MTYWDADSYNNVQNPNSSVDNAIARYDGTTGKFLQNSGARVLDNGEVILGCPNSAISDVDLDTSQASFYADETNNRIQVKFKKSNDVIISQDIPDVKNGQLVVVAQINNSVPLMAVGHATQAVNLIEARDNSSNVVARVNRLGQFYSKNTSGEPADGEFTNSQHTIWLDESEEKFQVKGKKADGTVVKHSIFPSAYEYILLKHQVSSGTDGGTLSNSGANTRTINVKEHDDTGVVTLGSNQFTLPAGTYIVSVAAVSFNCGDIKLYLRNITDSTNDLIGMTHETTGGGTSLHFPSLVKGILTVADTKTFEVQQLVSNTQNTNGQGRAINLGLDEIYLTAEFWKVN